MNASDPHAGERRAGTVGPPPPGVAEPVVIGALRTRPAGCERPRAHRIAGALPRDAMGEIRKAALRERYADAFA